MTKNNYDLKIPVSERTPVVMALLAVIETLQTQLALQSEKMDLLLEEIRCLKNISAKPKISPSKLPKEAKDNKDDDNDNPSSGNISVAKRAGSLKRNKTKALKIDKEEMITVKNVSAGAVHKGYQDYVVQDLIIKPIVIKYRLERWQLPDGQNRIAELPPGIKGHHFGPTLRTYILHQYHHQCVTQPLIRAQLLEWNIDISSGQLNRIILENKEEFHKEKALILKVGLSIADYIQVDDTGARHKGINSYCTFLGNKLFSWFATTNSKSRINFLELLRCEVRDYQLIEESFTYMERYNVAPWIREKLKNAPVKLFADNASWKNHIHALGIKNKHYVRRVTEAALIGSILNHGFRKNTVILSDDAGQFNVFLHALCWIHAERGIKSLIPGNELQREAVNRARNEIWEIYHALLDYKNNPDEMAKIQITIRFDKLCNKKTNYQTLNCVLKRLYKNKTELLRVLERPEIPLHNNQSENDIREYVKRRKISGSTRSDEGRQCRDTFASLKKTALKLKLKFWDYLTDRIHKNGAIPSLHQLLFETASR